MTIQGMIQGNIQCSRNVSALQSGSAQAQQYCKTNEDAAFGEILSSRTNNSGRQYGLDKNSVKTAECRSEEAASPVRSEKKSVFRTFREANDRNIKDAESSVKSVRNTNVDENVRQLPDADNKADKSDAEKGQTECYQCSVLSIFSQLLGISINDLQKILKKSGISDEAFSSMEDINGISSGISQSFQLDKNQQNILMMLLRLTSETGACIMEENEQAEAAENLSGVSKQQASIIEAGNILTDQLSAEIKELQVLKDTAADSIVLTDLESAVKLKLNEYGMQFETDKDAVGSELKELIQSLMAKAAVKVQEPEQQDRVCSAGENFIQTASVDDKSTSRDDGSNPDGYDGTDKETTIGQPAGITEKTQLQAAFVVIQADKTNKADVAAAAIEKIPVEAKEIISQVIERAKVVITPEKSEMLMDLKPESLGKISLKVVTENGIVLARFVAENQQVKQVLESNMQLLKDSLERQGINVQSFSVSVRQDSRQPADNRAQPGKSGYRNTVGTEYRSISMADNLERLMESPVAMNPFKWSGSTINLTA